MGQLVCRSVAVTREAARVVIPRRARVLVRPRAGQVRLRRRGRGVHAPRRPGLGEEVRPAMAARRGPHARPYLKP